MLSIVVGKTYHAFLNEAVCSFTITDYNPSDESYGVLWNDGDVDWLNLDDIDRLIHDYYLSILESASAGCM